MPETGVTLYYYVDYPSGKTATQEMASIADIVLTAKEKYRLAVIGNGTATGVSVSEDAVMSVTDNGHASDVAILAKISSGDVLDGYLYVGRNGVAENVKVYGDAEIDTLGVMSGATVYSGGAVSLFSNGILEYSTVEDGGRVYSYSSYLDAITLNQGGLAAVYGGGAEDITVNGGASLLLNNSSVLQGVKVLSGGSLSLSTGSCLTGAFHVAAGASLAAQEGTYVEFVLSSPSNTPSIEDFTCVSGTPCYFAAVAESQTPGSYALIGNASAFNTPLYVACGDYAMMAMPVGGTGTYHNSVYALEKNSGTLTVNVSDYQTGASASGLSWDDINGAASYVLEMSDVQLEIASRGVDLLGLAKGDYGWRVRNAAEADNWQTGQAFSQTEEPKEPRKLEAATNDAADLFFARTDGVWNSGYMAKHVGNGAWAGTGETVELAGMLRVTDVFAGSEDASILKLSLPAEELAQGGAEDEAGNASRFRAVRPAPEAQATGVALFLDDIYSASPVPEAQASGRLSQINTILATEGNDIIDLTSARFGCDDGMTVHGGAGNDILWGGGNGCRLFGDEGDDSLSGTAGNDILVGGSGNDVILCLGGEDILCFGPEWGNDVVVQQAGGKVTLWFAQGDERYWDAESMVYSDGDNSVRVAGVNTGDVTLKFGNDSCPVYAQFRDQGAFLA